MCVCLCSPSEKHLGADATIISCKKVCVLHAVRILYSMSCSQAVVTGHLNQGRASVEYLCVCDITKRRMKAE